METPGEKIGDHNLGIFKTPRTLNIDAVKVQCDPKLSANTEEKDLQFYIMHNMMFVFIKNILSQFSMILRMTKPNGQDLKEEIDLYF